MNVKQKDTMKQLKAIDAIDDKKIDYSDSPDCSRDDWTEFKPFKPSKTLITIRLDSDLVNYFKSMGKGYQSRINMVLREYKKHQIK